MNGLTIAGVAGGVLLVIALAVLTWWRKDVGRAASAEERARTAEGDADLAIDAAQAQSDVDQVIIDRRADLRERIKRGDI